MDAQGLVWLLRDLKFGVDIHKDVHAAPRLIFEVNIGAKSLRPFFDHFHGVGAISEETALNFKVFMHEVGAHRIHSELVEVVLHLLGDPCEVIFGEHHQEFGTVLKDTIIAIELLGELDWRKCGGLG